MGLPMLDKSRYTRSLKARRLRGVAALQEMITLIGASNATDHDMAHVLVDNELELRELVAFALARLAEPETVGDMLEQRKAEA